MRAKRRLPDLDEVAASRRGGHAWRTGRSPPRRPAFTPPCWSRRRASELLGDSPALTSTLTSWGGSALAGSATSATSSGVSRRWWTVRKCASAAAAASAPVEVGGDGARERELDVHRVAGAGGHALLERGDLAGVEVGEQRPVPPHQGIGDRHELAEHLLGWILDGDVVAERLGHLLHAVEALEQRQRHHDLRRERRACP